MHLHRHGRLFGGRTGPPSVFPNEVTLNHRKRIKSGRREKGSAEISTQHQLAHKAASCGHLSYAVTDQQDLSSRDTALRHLSSSS